MTLYEYLKAERGRQAKLARTIGQSQQFVRQIANGERPCPSRFIDSIKKFSGNEVDTKTIPTTIRFKPKAPND